ncbi:MAG: alpha/beta hydrolase-fold protein [Thermoprotei archaeon]
MESKIVVHRYESEVLKNNPLRDPYERDVLVYLPAGYSDSNSEGYVTVFGLVGFGGTGRSLLNWDPFSENIQQRMDRLIAEGKCGPMLLVLLDCFTKMGGNQYINSSATGNYEDYIVTEIVPFIDQNYNVAARAVWGKSSGGYGSIVLGMRHPDVFGALADHSGDSAFEYCYLPDFPKALDAFREAGGTAKWLEHFWSKPNRHSPEDMAPLNTLAMAAHYSPNPEEELGVELPFDLDSGEFRYDVWNRWLEWDPTRMVEKYADNLRKLRLIYIDCGTRDQFNLHWGARILHSKLKKLNIGHYYEEFDDTHSNITYRYDVSLPMIYHALQAGRSA